MMIYRMIDYDKIQDTRLGYYTGYYASKIYRIRYIKNIKDNI